MVGYFLKQHSEPNYFFSLLIFIASALSDTKSQYMPRCCCSVTLLAAGKLEALSDTSKQFDLAVARSALIPETEDKHLK